MLAKRFRFHGHSSLKFVYGKGRTVRSGFSSLKYTRNTRRESSRLAVVVSKKVTKRAPIRNRMRRRVFESMRRRWAMVVPGYDLVITVFDERIATMSAPALEADINKLLVQADLLKQ